MAQFTSASPRGAQTAFLPPSVTLAIWQLREAWQLLFITAIGMIAAVMLVCAIPLYSRIALSSGLHGILTATPDSSTVIIHSANTQLIPISATSNSTAYYNSEFVTNVGSYVNNPPKADTFLETPAFPMATNSTSLTPQQGKQMSLSGYPMKQLAPHVKLLDGRLPQATGQPDTVEIALPQEATRPLHLTVGSTLSIIMTAPPGSASGAFTLHLTLVGIFKPNSLNDTYWHSFDFYPSQLIGPNATNNRTIYKGLVSMDDFLQTVSKQFKVLSPNLTTEVEPWDAFWFYPLNITHLDANNLDNLMNGLSILTTHVGSSTQVLDELTNYRDRVSLVQVPVTTILILVGGMVLLFLSLISELLVERQLDAIAILRSRGASRRQVFGSFTAQCIAIGFIALFVGALLAIPAVHLFAQWTLPASDQTPLSLIDSNPLGAAWDLRWYAIIAVVVALIAIIFALYRATTFDVLSIRREAARTQRRPLWQRLYLDLFVGVLAISGYAFAWYETNTGTLDLQTQMLLLAPLTLLSSVCILLAALLLFLRIFPFLLRQAARIATHTRGPSLNLALAQMARTPRQTIRMTLLLSLATAFAIFTLIFTGTQGQRALDISAYQVGADFSGTLPRMKTPAKSLAGDLTYLASQTATLRNIRGVTAASAGYTANAFQNGNPYAIKAVDETTFAQAALWTKQDSDAPLSALMQQLGQARPQALAKYYVPAFIDSPTWDALHLSNGRRFTLTIYTGGEFGLQIDVPMQALGEVPHIPTLSNGIGDASQISNEGVLVDYQTLSNVLRQNINTGLTPNYYWLRTNDDAASLASVRAALSKSGVQAGTIFYDRRAVLLTLQHDPLYLDLMGVLLIGAITPLILAVVGSLVASYLSARARLIGFALLRALGTSPREIASVLIWEQSIVYTILIGLGIIAGILLSVLVLPALIFTNVLIDPSVINAINQAASGTGDNAQAGAAFINLPHLPPIQMVLPVSLFIALAVLIITCIVALGMMIRLVSRPSMSQTLRLNAD